MLSLRPHSGLTRTPVVEAGPLFSQALQRTLRLTQVRWRRFRRLPTSHSLSKPPHEKLGMESSGEDRTLLDEGGVGCMGLWRDLGRTQET